MESKTEEAMDQYRAEGDAEYKADVNRFIDFIQEKVRELETTLTVQYTQHTHTNTHTYTYTYTHMHTHTHAHTYICTHTRTHARTHTRTRTHIHAQYDCCGYNSFRDWNNVPYAFLRVYNWPTAMQ